MKHILLLLFAVSLCGCAARANVNLNPDHCKVVSVNGCPTDTSGDTRCTRAKLNCTTIGVSK